MIAFFIDLWHLLRVGWVFAAHDLILPDLLKGRQPPLANFLGRLARLFATKKKTSRVGERFAKALEKLGPTYIKLGQMLSSRPDIFGQEIAADLSCLKDKLPPIPKADAQKALEAAFGSQTSALFPQLEPAIAAASIAQVHKIATDSGFKAVKIQRPDIDKTIARQMRALARAAHWAQKHGGDIERLNPVAFIAGLHRSLREELDFRFEAGGADEIRAHLRNTEYFHIPKIDWERTQQTILTMDWIDGIALTQPDAMNGTGQDREKLAHNVMRGFLHLALNHGVFHADMHEGNLILMQDGQLGLIDFGIIGRIGPSEQNYLAEILYGFIQRDYVRVAEVHFRAGYVPRHHSVGAFAQALRSIGEPIQDKTAKDVAMSEVFLRLFDYTALFDMRMRPELVLLQKTMAQVEAICRVINPDHDIWESAKPVVQAWMKQNISPKRLLEQGTERLRTGHAIFDKLPSLIEKWEASLPATPSKLSPSAPLAIPPPDPHARRENIFAFLGKVLLGVGIGIIFASYLSG